MEQLPSLLLLALPLLLIWMVFSRTRRQQRILAAAQESIRPGLWAMTTSGLHGQVISAGDEPTVVLEIAPGVHTRWARQAIAEVFDEDPATKQPDDPVSDDSVPGYRVPDNGVPDDGVPDNRVPDNSARDDSADDSDLDDRKLN